MTMIDTLRAERDRLKTEARALVAKAETETRDLTRVEKTEFDALETDIDALSRRIDEIADIEQRKGAAEETARRIHPEENRTEVVTVRREPSTYTARSDGPSFFRDLATERTDWDARERLERHRRETDHQLEGRALTSSGVGGLVVPQYLPEMYAEYLRAGRVTANLCRGEDLPAEGMTLTIPRGTTGTLVASQSDQNTALTTRDLVATNLTINVNTLGGLQDVSRQTIDRGHNVDGILYADLVAEYNKQLDIQVINGAGTNGTHTGILSTTTVHSVTYSTGAMTIGGFYSKLANAAQQIASTRFLAPNVIVMHPRRWGFFASLTDSNGRPLIDLEGGSDNANMGRGATPGEGAVGSMQGLPVFLDSNIPTTNSSSTVSGATEDVVIVARREDWLLWEDVGRAPMTFRFEEVLGNQLSVRLVAAGYSAFTSYWHPEGCAVLSGSCFTAPSF